MGLHACCAAAGLRVALISFVARPSLRCVRATATDVMCPWGSAASSSLHTHAMHRTVVAHSQSATEDCSLRPNARKRRSFATSHTATSWNLTFSPGRNPRSCRRGPPPLVVIAAKKGCGTGSTAHQRTRRNAYRRHVPKTMAPSTSHPIRPEPPRGPP